ncbi:hypothetical protein [Xanthobacter oligotrophicus]|uniref:hypothetical protein n=1 Tax=Xanthobacter oligotrophicus TaxID=2607286 RepID=UPI0011F0BA8D|nr:hypothetical protein [Xanthobacter oligotrophicus]MCG5233964.1 hypothetical protein [Xanthobacter oligotrophicus]
MSAPVEAGSELGLKFLTSKLDEYMIKNGVQEQLRSNIINSIEMMYEYIPYAMSKDPSNPKVFGEFMAIKLGKMAKYSNDDDIKCAISILEFILSVKKLIDFKGGGGYPPLLALMWGLAMLNLIEVGNSCSAVQEATYHLFLKENSAKIMEIRRFIPDYSNLVCKKEIKRMP